MFIKTLEISGFRSYRSPTSISFSQSNNIIRGPNGSGKSNLIRAIQLGFGFKLGQLTSDERKLSLSYPNSIQSEASISLLLDLSPSDIPSDFFLNKEPQILLSRSISLEEDVYLINKERPSLKQVIFILTSLRVGQFSAFSNVVNQGRVVNWAEVDEYKRLQIVKNFLGISFYEQEKTACERLVESIRLRNRPRLVEIKDFIEGRLSSFRAEKEGLDRLRAAEAQRQLKESELLEVDSELCRRQVLYVKRLSEGLAPEIESTERRMAGVEGELSREKKKRRYLQLEITQTLDRKRKEGLGKRAGRLLGVLQPLKGFAKEKSGEPVEKAVAHAEQQGQLLREETVKLKAQLEEACALQPEAECVKFKERLLEEIKTSDGTLGSKKQFAEFLLRKKNVLSKAKSAFGEYHRRNAREISALKGEMARIEGLKGRKTDELARQKEAVDRIKERAGAARERQLRLRRLWKKKYRMEKKIDELQSQQVVLRKEFRKAAGVQASMLLEFLAFLEQENKFRAEMYGLVAGLLQCAGRFERALEASLGRRLYFIVIESEDCFKWCLNKLSAFNAGFKEGAFGLRVNFLVMENFSRRGSASEGKEEDGQDEGVKYEGFSLMSEHVTADDRIKNNSAVMDYLVGRVYVSDDEREGDESVPNPRAGDVLVTLDGDLYRRNEISGGHTGSGALETYTNLRGVENDLAETVSSVEKVQADIDGLESAAGDKSGEKGVSRALIEGLLDEVCSLEREAANSAALLGQKVSLQARSSARVEAVEAKLRFLDRVITHQKRAAKGDDGRESSVSLILRDITNTGKSGGDQLRPVGKLLQQSAGLSQKLLDHEIKRAELNKRSLLSQFFSAADSPPSLSPNSGGAEKEEQADEPRSLDSIKSEITDSMKKSAGLKRSLFELDEKALRLNTQKNEYQREIYLKRMQIEKNSNALRKLPPDSGKREKEDLLAEKSDANEEKRLGSETVSKLESKKNELRRALHQMRSEINELIQKTNRKALVYANKFEDKLKEIERNISEINDIESSIIQLLEFYETKKESTLRENLSLIISSFKQLLKAVDPEVFGEGGLEILEENGSPVALKLAMGGALGKGEMSGGQKSIVALCFFFALNKTIGLNVLVFDEVDANLDEEYRKALAMLLKDDGENRSVKAQVIISSFRKEILELEGEKKNLEVRFENNESMVDFSK